MKKVWVCVSAALWLLASSAWAESGATSNPVATARRPAASVKVPPKPARYPMRAAAFKGTVDKNLARAKERLEARLKRERAPAARASAARARFAKGASEVRLVVAKVTQDGRVTREEAREVKAKSRMIRAVLVSR